jgi:hypothetical protein
VSTRGELTTMVLQRLGVSSARTGFVTQVQNHMNRIYVREVVDLGLNMAESELVFTADDATVNLPADWRRTETLRLGARTFIETTDSVLQELDAAGALSGYAAASDTSPARVAYFPPRRIRMTPPPTADSIGGTLIYHAAPALMSTDDDEPDAIPEEFQDLIAELVIHRMAMNQEDPTMAQDAYAAAGLAKQMLQDQIARGMGSSSGRVRRAVYG